MKHITLLLLSSLLFITACTKDETTTSTSSSDPCPTGTIQFINNSQNPYDIFIDGSLFRQQSGRTTMKKEQEKGTYTIKVRQVSGYLISPTVQEYRIEVKGCDEKTISFP